MSVVNIYVSSERVLCLTDTLAYAKMKPVALVKKKCTIYYGGMFALAARGRSIAIDMIEETACDFASIDDLSMEFPKYVKSLSQDLIVSDSTTGLQIFAVGFSKSNGRVIALKIERKTKRNVLTDKLSDGYHVYPGLDKPGGDIIGRLPKPATSEIMRRVAMAQWRVQSEMNVNLCIGGAMHLTEISKSDIERRVIGLYPDYQEYRTQFGDPAEEEVADYTSLLNDDRGMVA